MLLVLFGAFTTAFAERSADGFWFDVAEPMSPLGKRVIIPVQYRSVGLNVDALIRMLRYVPMEGGVAIQQSTRVLSLPLPEGGFRQFRIVESPVMAPELTAKYPAIKTYLGQGIDDPTATARFDVTPFGFHGIIFSSGHTVYIDPYSTEDTRHYISYFKQNLLPDDSKYMDEIGIVDPNNEAANEIAQLIAAGSATHIGEQLRTYRLALACTGEYAAFHGGTKPLVLAAMVTAMNRVVGVYEREVAVRMVLIANNDTLIYLNASTDPYTNTSGSTMLGQNQSTLDNIVGSGNYDIGHVFSTGGGGIAGLGVVCRTGNKARGVTGLSSPTGDPFYIDYVAHEMGHQFGGNHSFNGNAGSCGGGNRNASTAYEPGSGTTIMAYAGICGAHNTQNYSDDYFHGISIDEIVAYTTAGSGSSCPVITQTGNNAPVVDAGVGGYNIPISTPFSLTGSATDGDGDILTFTWEEFDLGAAGNPNTPTGNAAIFRSFKGTTNPTRILPRMSDILNGTQTIGELLPSYARTMNFRLTARDNRAGGGGVGKASTSVNAIGTAGPFMITSPNTAISWVKNSQDTVKWNVANTGQSPISCTSVNILLSTDGGQTFTTTLASNTTNDGVQVVSIPNVRTETARVKIEAVGNIFFDISNVNFAIAPVASPVLSSPANSSLNQPTSLSLRWRRVSGATAYHLQLSTNSSFVGAIVDDSTLTDSSRSVSGLTNNLLHYWRVRARNAEGYSGWTDTWSFRTVPLPPAQPTLVAPANNAVNLPPTITLQWGALLNVTSYRVEVSADSLFATRLIDDSTVTTIQRSATLSPGTRYFWRVRAKNAGGSGPTSAVWNFATQQLPAQVALVSPANAATVNADTVQVVWRTAGTINERYWFEFATDSLFAARTVDSTLTDTSHVVRALLANQLYWWKVRAGNNAGWGLFSTTRRFVVVLTSVSEIAGIPDEFMLSQNYPNPFNPSTIIAFAIPREAHVTLGIYNLLGERVADLLDERKPVGYYSAVFHAEGMASGIYLYKLKAGDFIQSKKLILVR